MFSSMTTESLVSTNLSYDSVRIPGYTTVGTSLILGNDLLKTPAVNLLLTNIVSAMPDIINANGYRTGSEFLYPV